MEKIGFIGAGKVGTAMAKYLQLNGYEIIGFYSQDYPTDTYYKHERFNQLESLIAEVDILYITTPDDVIETTSNLVADRVKDLTGKLILHCSGALSSTGLEACQGNGALIGTLHPLQAFTGLEADVKNLTNSYLTLESPLSSHDTINHFVQTLNNKTVWIETDQKQLYHASAVVISNYMVTLLNEGLTYMEAIGIKQDQAYQMMTPLIESTLSNISSKGTIDGLTGPILRGDLDTIKGHMTQIDKKLSKPSSDFYRLMGQMTLNMVRSTRIDEDTYQRFDQYFKE